MSANDDKKARGAQSAVPEAGGGKKPPATLDLTAKTDDKRASGPVKPAPAEAKPEPEAPRAAPARDSGAGDVPPKSDDGVPLAGAIPPAGRPPEPAADRRSGYGWGMLVVAALVGGIIATALGIAYHASGIVPTRSETIAREALDKINGLAASIDGLDSRIAALETQTAAPAGDDIAALVDQVTKLQSQVSDNSTALARLSEGAVSGGPDQALEAIEARLSKLETTVGAGPDPAITGLPDRMAALEASLARLGDKVDILAAQPDQAAETVRAARAIAVTLVQQAANRGGSFVADLAMIKALGTDGDDLAALEPLAAKDTPSLATLQQDFVSVADSILEATAGSDPDAGLLGQLAALGGDLVTVRPIEPIEGDTAAAIVSRMQAAVDQADLAGALSERQGLPEAGQAASAVWAAQASDRVAIDTLVQKLVLSMTAAGN